MALVVLCESSLASASHPPDIPRPQRILIAATDARQLAIGMRFGGYVLSRDGGASWFSVCPAAIGYDDTETYPGVLGADGSLVLSTGYGGIASSNDGCDWSQWLPAEPSFFADLKRAPEGGLFALNSRANGERFTNEIWASTDGGRHFERHGNALPDDVLATSLLPSSSDGDRLYVAAVSAAGAELLRSDDRAATFQRSSMYDLRVGMPVLIGVVGPEPELLLALIDVAQFDGSNTGGDFVVVSYDSGRTWGLLFQAQGDLLGAALSSDGRLALGGPDDGIWLLRLDPRVMLEERVSTLATRGLSWSAGRLYSSALEAIDGFSLAVSDDEGKTFTPVLSLCDVHRALACAAGSGVTQACAAEPGLDSPDPLASCAEPAENPGTSSQETAEEGGCSIRVRRARASGALPILALLLIGVAMLRRRCDDGAPDSERIGTASTEDRKLVDGLIEGRPSSAERLYAKLRPVIDRTVRRVFSVRPPDHDDLVQTALEQIVRSLLERRFQAACSLSTWASVIAARVAIDELRNRARERNLFRQGMQSSPDVLSAPEPVKLERQLEARSELLRLEGVLGRMKAEQSATLLLHDLFGHELGEIANLTGVTATAAQSRLVRGRRELFRRVSRRRIDSLPDEFGS
jgi:RNA polymerase sigma factor (sigma-70 family)